MRPGTYANIWTVAGKRQKIELPKIHTLTSTKVKSKCGQFLDYNERWIGT